MKAGPLISVIMLNRNGERFIAEAIASVALQHYQEWELIIIENCSEDHSFEIIQQWRKKEPRIRAIRLAQALNIPSGRNAGLKESMGQYIATLDSDDLWLPERLSRQVGLMERKENESIGVCGSSCWLINESGQWIGKKEFPLTPVQCLTSLWYRNPFCHSATLVRRCCFDRFGFYDESFDVAQDLELWFRLGQAYQLMNLPDCLVKYRVWDQSVTWRAHRSMVRHTLRARKLGLSRYGYTLGAKERLFLIATWLMQWFSPEIVHWLFDRWVLKSSLISPGKSLSEGGAPPRTGAGKKGGFLSPATAAKTNDLLLAKPVPGRK